MPSDQLGKATRIEDSAGRYIEFCKSTFPNELDLRGLKITLDCANGATYHVAPHVFHELGAEVVAIANHPDGININAGCGSTYVKLLQETVKNNGSDIGIALDGDGDRLIMVDAEGKVFDGDKLIYIIAKHRRKAGTMQGGVVGTLMTNLGFEHALEKLKIPFARAAVGDRYVLEMLEQKGWQLGGETSGHIICRDRHTTGDGIVSALQVLHALRANKTTLGDFTKDLMLYPQVLINVTVDKSFDFRESIPIQAALVEAECALDGNGRVLLRNSGTEPFVRVMVEGKVEDQVKHWAERIADAVKTAAAGH
jgi:phosphoglucosamine mutase